MILCQAVKRVCLASFLRETNIHVIGMVVGLRSILEIL